MDSACVTCLLEVLEEDDSQYRVFLGKGTVLHLYRHPLNYLVQLMCNVVLVTGRFILGGGSFGSRLRRQNGH